MNTPYTIPDNRSLNPALLLKLEEITAALESHWTDIESIGLLDGRSGIALYFFYYSLFTHNHRYADLGHQVIASVMDTVDNSQVPHSFCSGLAGFGWALAHLSNRGFIDDDPAELFEDLDDFLANAMTSFFNRFYWDYLHGALGCGLYFLERLKNKASSSSIHLSPVIDFLEKQGEPSSNNHICWSSMINNKTMALGYNLSLSHGMASIVAILSRILETQPNQEKVAALLTGAVEYILAQAQEPGQHGSHFPAWVCEAEPARFSRLAWCYGDLGTGIALLRAAGVMKNQRWGTRALEVLEHTSTRRDPYKEQVSDGGLCHGAAGLSHCYRHIYTQTGQKRFAESADYWLNYTLDRSCHPDGPAGYKALQEKGFINEYGILNGISGIGLALLTALSDIKPTWDAFLLLT